MRIGMLDIGGKMPNLALMKLAAFHKKLGDQVVLNHFAPGEVDRVYISVLFTKDRRQAEQMVDLYSASEVIVGGPGWDLTTELSPEVEAMAPDYDLYTVEGLYDRMKGVKSRETRLKRAEQVVNAGIGFTTRGCPRSCSFCVVPAKEGKLRKVGEIADLINPRSNRIILLDNNFTADPDALDKITEIRERGLEVNISQGIDVRTITPGLAEALAGIKLINGTIHYAWDLPDFEQQVLSGIDRLSQHLKTWRHMCYMLVGFNTTFEEDMMRYRKLWEERKVHPYVMIYNRDDRVGGADLRLRHFARWVNARIHKTCRDFEEYDRWAKVRDKYFENPQGELFGAT